MNPWSGRQQSAFTNLHDAFNPFANNTDKRNEEMKQYREDTGKKVLDFVLVPPPIKVMQLVHYGLGDRSPFPENFLSPTSWMAGGIALVAKNMQVCRTEMQTSTNNFEQAYKIIEQEKAKYQAKFNTEFSKLNTEKDQFLTEMFQFSLSVTNAAQILLQLLQDIKTQTGKRITETNQKAFASISKLLQNYKVVQTSIGKYRESILKFKEKIKGNTSAEAVEAFGVVESELKSMSKTVQVCACSAVASGSKAAINMVSADKKQSDVEQHMANMLEKELKQDVEFYKSSASNLDKEFEKFGDFLLPKLVSVTEALKDLEQSKPRRNAVVESLKDLPREMLSIGVEGMISVVSIETGNRMVQDENVAAVEFFEENASKSARAAEAAKLLNAMENLAW